jgi:hypothetical protein
MAEVGISYEAHAEPNPISFNVAVGVSGTQVHATVGDVQPFVAVLKPTGNIAQVILSGAAWPLAQTIGVALPPLATRIVHQLPTIRITTIDPIASTVDGEHITITPSNLTIADWNGMLMISGAVDIR